MKSKKDIVLIGSSGNLGRILFQNLKKKNFQVKTFNSSHSDFDLASVSSAKMIINAANRYFPFPSSIEKQDMYNSILQVAKNVVALSARLDCPILHFSSYFQYAPLNLRPWSEYAVFKSEAVDIYNQHSNQTGIPNFEIILFDNFGGHRGGKFLDLLIDSIFFKRKVEATEGQSVVNYSSIHDIGEWITENLVDIDQGTTKDCFQAQLKGPSTYSLRELAQIVSLFAGRPVQVNWGAINYREKEVFELWDCAKNPDNWFPQRTLEAYLKIRFKENRES